jgi:hypothetical protein
MPHPLCSALALCASLALPNPLLAQLSEPPQTTLPSPPDYATMLPLTTKSTYTYTQTSSDGKTSSQTEETVVVNDSQGRRSTANTVTHSGVTTYLVDDPIAAKRFSWISSSKLAKALKYPEPIAGRRSCWKIPPEELAPARGEPHLNITGTTCMPAEYPLRQGPYCKSEYLPTSSARDFPLVSVTAPSCASLFQRQPFEDLGTKSINGFLAQGCSTNGQHGYQINEAWWITLTSGTLTANLQVQALAEYQGPNHQDLKTTQNLTLLQVREPDPSTFRPSPDAEIRTVEMHEVPCAQALPPA